MRVFTVIPMVIILIFRKFTAPLGGGAPEALEDPAGHLFPTASFGPVGAATTTAGHRSGWCFGTAV